MKRFCEQKVKLKKNPRGGSFFKVETGGAYSPHIKLW